MSYCINYIYIDFYIVSQFYWYVLQFLWEFKMEFKDEVWRSVRFRITVKTDRQLLSCLSDLWPDSDDLSQIVTLSQKMAAGKWFIIIINKTGMFVTIPKCLSESAHKRPLSQA